MNKFSSSSLSVGKFAVVITSTLVFLTATLSPTVLASTEKKVVVTEKPNWAKSNYTSVTGLDFIGLSQLWVAGLPQAEQQSISEACTDGLGKISEYFSVEIASKSSSSQVVVNEQFQGEFSVSTNKFSRINLSGINVTASFTEVVEKGEYVQSYCLYRLNRQQVNKIQRRLTQEQQAIEKLVTNIGHHLTVRDVQQAKINLALLKGKRNVSAELTAELSKLITELEESMLNVDMVFSKHAFAAKDVLAVQLQTNQNLFVYEFVDDGRFINMLLPSPAYGFNLINKGQPKKFPTQQQLKSGNFYKLPRLSLLNHAPTVYIVASKKRLPTPFIQASFSSFIVNDKDGFKQFIKRCQLDQECAVIQRDILLADNKFKLEIQRVKLRVNKTKQPRLNRTFRASLLEQGFTFSEEGYDLTINLNYKKIFSKKLSADMFVGELRVFSRQAQKKTPVLRLKYSGIYDSERVDNYLESMLRAASVKLLQRVEEQQGDI